MTEKTITNRFKHLYKFIALSSNLGKFFPWLVGLFALSMLVLASLAGWASFSPVPYWDAWHIPEFFMQIQDGEYLSWWIPHNEHRILLSRLLFWIDNAIFAGNGAFLVIMNYVLVTISCLLFGRYVSQLSKNIRANVIVWGLTVGFLFSWIQRANLSDAFQSQFFFAYLIPLAGFYMLARYAQYPSNRSFVAACLLGVASIGSMINGIFALPMMLCYGLWCGLPRKKVIVLLLLTLGAIGIYFYRYTFPAGGSSVMQALRDMPTFVNYVLALLGSPLAYYAGNAFVAIIAGLIFIILALYLLIKIHRENDTRRLFAMALLGFIAYVGVAICAIASGRAAEGIQFAFASRYTTPILMAWAALGIVLWVYSGRKTKQLLTIISIVLAILALFWQFSNTTKALKNRHWLVARDVSALALVLDIKDQQFNFTQTIYPNVDVPAQIVRKAIGRNVSIFNRYPYNNIGQAIGNSHQPTTDKSCVGGLDRLRIIPDNSQYVGVQGWLYDNIDHSVPTRVTFVYNNQVVGFALTGFPRQNKAKSLDDGAKLSGFYGYVLRAYSHLPLTAFGDGVSVCQVTFAPRTMPLISVTPHQDAKPHQVDISLDDVINNQQFTGKDYQKTTFDDLQVLGSRITSDADTGAITVEVREGFRILYRTGPRTKQQFIVIDNKPYNLPVSENWSILEYAAPSDARKTITFIDQGTGWGEWTAIALLKSKPKPQPSNDGESAFEFIVNSGCVGAIDAINENENIANVAIQSPLIVRGWLASATTITTPAEDAYLVLSDKQGNTQLIKTQHVFSKGLGEHFANPNMASAGFRVQVDVSGLQGQFTMGLAYEQANKMHVCKLAVPITIQN